MIVEYSCFELWFWLAGSRTGSWIKAPVEYLKKSLLSSVACRLIWHTLTVISSSLCWSWAGIGYTVTVTSSRSRGRRFYQHSKRPRAFDFSALISPSTVYCIVLMGETTERSPLKYTLVFLCEFWRPRLLCRPAIPSVLWSSESILTPGWLTPSLSGLPRNINITTNTSTENYLNVVTNDV